jgi:hypothetical protein
MIAVSDPDAPMPMSSSIDPSLLAQLGVKFDRYKCVMFAAALENICAQAPFDEDDDAVATFTNDARPTNVFPAFAYQSCRR